MEKLAPASSRKLGDCCGSYSVWPCAAAAGSCVLNTHRSDDPESKSTSIVWPPISIGARYSTSPPSGTATTWPTTALPSVCATVWLPPLVPLAGTWNGRGRLPLPRCELLKMPPPLPSPLLLLLLLLLLPPPPPSALDCPPTGSTPPPSRMWSSRAAGMGMRYFR
ncbi:hypothetical protein VTK73DRAFT_9751 [Phialemonium thermophilum]|uniref:Uncharacterized protein n=1 Tax=Phialemonium thermophilum TaxID=223376 RepID=A0ABR3W0L5_9PEZI